MCIIRICVGSRNPCKLRGVEKAFKLVYGNADVLGYDVKGLASQPVGLKMTFDSARHRAREVMRLNADCDFYVGVEAGLIEVEGVGYFDVHIACIICRDGRELYGLSPAFMIPQIFAEKILSKEVSELEEIVDKWFGTKDIGERGGLISLLTGGTVIRDELVYYSVVSALIPIINPELYLRANR